MPEPTAKEALDYLKNERKLSDSDVRSILFNNQEHSARGILISLVNNNKIEEEDAIKVAQGLGLAKIKTSSEIETDFEIVKKVPKEVSERNKFLPLTKEGNKISILTVFPMLNDIRIKGILTRGYNVASVEYFITTSKDLEKAINDAHHASRTLAEVAQVSKTDTQKASIAKSIEGEATDSNVAKFVNIFISQSISDKASDIHIEPTEKTLYVRRRIDGVLHDLTTADMSLAPAIVSRIKILAEMDIAETRKPQDGRITVKTKTGADIDLRVAILPTVWGEKVVLRILDNTNAIIDIDKLGFSPYDLSRYRSGYKKPQGMILVTGPTGSGKSTTLYATLNDITHPGINVITVEDPVEYKINRINQIQINNKIGLTFADTLRTILRADPDVILVGEIRDSETAKIATEASQTGHLVLSTLHTNNAVGAITRLKEMGVETYLIGNVLESVVAQRLIRKLCNNCKIKTPLKQSDLDQMGILPTEISNDYIYNAHPNGCDQCSKTGYQGRIAVHEVVVMTPELEELVQMGATTLKLQEQAIADGTKTIRQSGWDKVLQGLSSIPEVLRVTA